MRLTLCGTPEFAVPTLRLLLAETDFTVVAVVTQPDRPKGRGLEAVPSAVKTAAMTAGIPVHQPESVRTEEFKEWLAGLAPDAVVILAYGQIVPANLLAIPRLGWINLHASLLPKYRGAAPIAWAIANGESCTGLTTMRIDAGMDTGPILVQQEMKILPEETARALSARMAEAGAPLLVATLRGLENGTVVPRPQEHALATHAPLLKREDGRIDWTLRAEQIHNHIRAFAPWPGASSSFRGQRCQIGGRPAAPGTSSSEAQAMAPGMLVVHGADLDVACGGGTYLRIETVQIEGRKRVSVQEFLSGARLAAGERFGV